MQPINAYLKAVRDQLGTGIAGEHAYRPALEALLRSLAPDLTPVNDPQRIECGAPDFIIVHGQVPVAYVEAKDVDADLRKTERTDQLKRYLDALPNLILTDYLEFRWYVDGKLRDTARLGETSDKGLRTTESDAEAVEKLLVAFLHYRASVVGTAKALASRMANLAQLARSAIMGVLSSEGEQGQLHGQLQAFRQVLIPDLSEDAFADMYAQTVAYGLFAARCGSYPPGPPPSEGGGSTAGGAPPADAGPQDAGETPAPRARFTTPAPRARFTTPAPRARFTRQAAAWQLPKTNPFLREMFSQIAGPSLDARIAWVVDDLADLLDRAEMGEVLEDFARQTGREDPVVHFYETFLREYDPKLREVRGVYYTPEPVVSYIVRSVDHILKTDFGLPLGLADPSVFILDPACGTGTFLYFAIRLIHQTIVEKQGAGAWSTYVREHLLQRLFGFELLMAPYTIAHMKLALLLGELGYDFSDDQRLGIYLTNTLEEAATKSEAMFAHFIADEANAASEIKRDKPIMVVMGNPPYSGHSANKGVWISKLLRDYHVVDGKPLGERNPKWLQDDYVKFLRFGEWRLERSGAGILAFITNHGYLDNPTFRGLRQRLMTSFDAIRVLDLHGNSKKKEIAPDGNRDENVFDIQQGVAIGIFVKHRDNAPQARGGGVAHQDLWGVRSDKYGVLESSSIKTTKWHRARPQSPYYLYRPRESGDFAEYNRCPLVTDVFAEHASTITLGRNEFLLAFDLKTITDRIREFRGTETSDDELRRRYSMGVVDLHSARDAVRADKAWESRFRTMLYRPFDTRHIFYSGDIVTRPRFEIMRHMLHPNLALLTHRPQSPGDFTYVYCGNLIADQCVAANKTAGGGNSYLMPLYAYSNGDELAFGSHRRPNLNPKFIAEFSAKLGLRFIEDGEGNLTETFGPEDIFHYMYAVFHSPTYRERYKEFLKIDFPRLPLTGNRDLFASLCALGKELVALHLMESPALEGTPARFEGAGDNEVEAIRYDEGNHRVCINKTQHFSGVAPEVYAFQVGGYQVLNKWLKDRKGRTLSYDDIRHYCRVVMALQETLRLMTQIDAAIPGWPMA